MGLKNIFLQHFWGQKPGTQSEKGIVPNGSAGSVVSFKTCQGLKCWCVASTTSLKDVSATFLLLCFVCLKESTCEPGKNVFHFTSKALFLLQIIKY